MKKKSNTKVEVFLDASYAIALSVWRDSHHERAIALADELETNQTRMVTTRAVMLEIGNALSKQRYRSASIELLRSIQEDPNITIVPLTLYHYTQAFQLYCERPDKEWGMTDCISFIIMRNRKIMDALTTDEHFQQAGFRALLLTNYS
ncbi:MAG: type II toxin-antitoxin system VapC family toxin [Desulfobacterales bacterium]|nr:type II toxin-antitoxin system VapC family toxin [Desulfobacterales bacterium]